MVIPVSREAKKSEKVLRVVMIICAVLFLLFGVAFSTGFMLPCFLMTATYFFYKAASKKEWEYTLNRDRIVIERISERGRILLHDIPLKDIEILCDPDDPAVAKYRRGGEERITKYDYTSYREGIPYCTVIARENGRRIKMLLDLPPEAVRQIRMVNHTAVLLTV